MTTPPPGSARWRSAVTELHRALRRSSYELIGRLPTAKNRLAIHREWKNLHGLVSGSRRLLESSAFPALYPRVAAVRHPELPALLDLFFLGDQVSAREATGLLNSLRAPALDELVDVGVFEEREGGVASRLRFVPVGGSLVVTDRNDRTIDDFTYLGRDSLLLADALSDCRPKGRALDLCCGTGIQSLVLAEQGWKVLGVDLNPRAVAFARLNATLNGLEHLTEFAQGNLAQGVDGPFELLVSNPPYVWMPEGEENLDGFGGDLGLALVQEILRELPRLLAPNGEAKIVTLSPVFSGRPALLDQLEPLGRELGVVAHELEYSVDPARLLYQRQAGASHNVFYLLHVGRNLPLGVRSVRLPYSGLRSLLYARGISPLLARLLTR